MSRKAAAAQVYPKWDEGWTISEPAADTLPDKGVVSRQRILDQIADTDTLLIGSHFSNPVAGKVASSKDGFTFEV